MNRYLSKLGFTMIELLVVIAVIGVLAVAVLSSINPIEQINKGRDVRAQSDASQLISALDRYYATQERYPWNEPAYCTGCATIDDPQGDPYDSPESAYPGSGANTSPACGASAIPAGGSPGEGMCTIGATNTAWTTILASGTNEVKDTFLTRLNATEGSTYEMYIDKSNGAQATVSVCFRPSSTSFQKDALDTCKRYKPTGGWPGGNPPPGLPAAACPETEYPATLVVGDTPGNELICMPFGKAK